MSSYNYLNIIVIGMLMVTLCYPIFTEAAAIPSEQLSEELQHTKELQDFKKIRVLRSSEEAFSDENQSKVVRNCYNMPCGWAVYHKQTRNVEYYLKNTSCECEDKSYKCVRAGDDLSASAYFYRCRQNTTADDIESPEDAN